MYTSIPPRRTHHKRFSATRLSSDTTVTQASLPEYRRDPPPDYEADHSSLEMDRPEPALSRRTSASSGASSPRKLKRHRHASSEGDALLDTLLERSVHALEMSNSLLQTSMSTQSSLRRINSRRTDSSDSESEDDWSGSRRRLGGRKREQWAVDMEDITRDVDRLFADDGPSIPDAQPIPRLQPRREASISSSLPSTSPIASLAHRRGKRRPSLDQINIVSDIPEVRVDELPHSGHLRHAPQERLNLVAPPPRALTQYITHEEADALALPSTLGLRSSGLTGSKVHLESPPSSAGPSPKIPQSIRVVDGLPSSSSSSTAYDILSSYAAKPSPAPPKSPLFSLPSPNFSASTSNLHRSLSSTSSHFSFTGLKSRRWSGSSQSTTSTARKSDPDDRTHKVARSRSRGSLPSRGNSRSPASSRSRTPKTHSGSPHDIAPIHTPRPQQSPCNPPIPEESSLSSSASSDSSSDLHAEQTITSLRAILTSHPPPPPKESETDILIRTKRPRFVPRSSSVLADVGSSTATASVSKLFSRSVSGGKHSIGTRPDSPPKPSSFKGGRKRAREREKELESGASTPNTAPGSTLSSAPMTPADPAFPSGMMTPLTPVDPTATPLPATTQSATASLVSNLPPSTSLSPPGSKRTSLSPGSSIAGIWNALTHPSGVGSSTTAASSSGGASDDGNESNGKGHRKRISFAELPEGTSSSTLRSSSSRKSSRRQRSSTSSNKSKKQKLSSSSDDHDQEGTAGWLSWFVPPVPPTSSSSSEVGGGSGAVSGAGHGHGHGTRAMMGSMRAPDGMDFWGGI